MDNRPKIITKTNSAIPVPSLPQILFKLIEVCKNSSSTPEDIVRVVSLDPGITLKLMRLAFVWQKQKLCIRTLEQTIAILGPENIRKLALTALVTPLSNRVIRNAALHFNRFWLHSLQCAILARKLAEQFHYGFANDAYLCGLLHDVGKLILWMNFRKDYEPLLKEMPESDKILNVENDRIGMNHCDIGWRLIRSLPSKPLAADSILYHHRPVREIAGAFPAVKIVYAANVISHRKNDTFALAETMEEIGFHLPPEQLKSIIEDVWHTTSAVLNFLGLYPEALNEIDVFKSTESYLPIYEFLGEIRELSLIQIATGSISAEGGRKAVQKELFISLQILFDIASAFFFYYQPADNVLIGKPTPDSMIDGPIDSIEMPVKPGSSVPSMALIQREVIDSFGHLTNSPVNIADEQLIHLLGTEGMLCLPMLVNQKRVGVIVAGIDEPQFSILTEQLSILKQFSDHAALLLQEFAYDESQASVNSTMDGVNQDSLRRIIHEVNNPLGIIKNYLKVLGSKIGENSDAGDEIFLIREEIERIPGIIKQLSGAEKITERNGGQIDINRMVHDLTRLLKKSVLEPSSITLHFFPDPKLPPFPGKKNGLNQVLINLLKNSVEAMPKGGNIFIKTASERPQKNLAEGNIVITIRDDGPGIPDQIMSRLFEPGNTSKGTDNFGLGLSISKDIITRYHGRISCNSRVNEGTTFTIKLPVSDINSKSSME